MSRSPDATGGCCAGASPAQARVTTRAPFQFDQTIAWVSLTARRSPPGPCSRGRGTPVGVWPCEPLPAALVGGEGCSANARRTAYALVIGRAALVHQSEFDGKRA